MVTDVGRGLFAKQTRMMKGFVIIGINNKPVGSINELHSALEQGSSAQIQGFYPGQAGMYYYGLNNIDLSSDN
jgi:hypothetical protein